MDTQIQTRNSATELKTRITERIQELAQATDAARVSEEMQRYLDMCSRFHQYSPCNVWLILMSQPNASYVAGFKKWQSMERYVRKGEHGIPILAPIITTATNDIGIEEQHLVGFKVVYVFDVSQTDGEPLPEPPNWKSPEKNAELQNSLIRFANSKGIVVQIKPIGRDVQGVSLGGKIVVDPGAGFKTYAHEVAHELLHHIENAPMDRTTRELEAESVAYVVATHFGLDSLSSPNYNVLHGATAEMIMEHLERIRSTASEIIKAIE
jgi:antirestriction protein ArdC